MTSPLRYPGGKTRARNLLWTFLQKEHPGITELVSPFFGGGSFELFCAEKGIQVYGNDKFTPLAVFWNQVKTDPHPLAKELRELRPVTKQDFHFYRNTIGTEEDPLKIATYYFTINRCSFNGSTFCGGYSLASANGRFNIASILRMEQTNMKNIVSITNVDALECIRSHPDKVLFLDPPYYVTNYLYGRDGDLHKGFDHNALATELLQRKNWILCYNDCEYIRELYAGCRIQSVSWSYGMNTSKASSEVVILPAV